MTKSLLKRPDVERLTGLSRASIYARLKRGTFPLPVRIGPNSVAWRADDVEDWIANLPVASELRGETRATAG